VRDYGIGRMFSLLSHEFLVVCVHYILPNNQGSIFITFTPTLDCWRTLPSLFFFFLVRLMSVREEDKRNGTWSFENHQEMMDHVLIILAADQLDPVLLMSARIYSAELPEHDDKITINGEIYAKYETAGNPARLTAAALAKLLADTATVKAERTESDARFRKTLAKLLALRSPAMSRAMDNLPKAAAAMKSFDIYEVWPLLMEAVTLPGANSAMLVLHSCVTTLSLPNFAS
jgi:hypothetical protein